MQTLEPQRLPLTMLLMCSVGASLLLWSQRTGDASPSVARQSTARTGTNVRALPEAPGGIHVTAPPSMMIQQWESRRLTWRVTGTQARVQLQLKNEQTQVAMLQGGNTQIVT